MKEIKSRTEYTALISGIKPVLIDFYADWCGPCRALLPVVERLADKYKDEVEIAKINVDHNRGLAQQYGVRSIPALFFLQDGEVKEQLLGVQSERILDDKIQTYIGKQAAI